MELFIFLCENHNFHSNGRISAEEGNHYEDNHLDLTWTLIFGEPGQVYRNADQFH